MRTQAWWPDTHPGHELHTLLDGDEFIGCVRAVINGNDAEAPQAVYDAVLLENQLKNTTLNLIRDNLPAWIDPESVEWDFGEADGLLSFTIPGATDDVLALLRGLVPDGVTVA
jgi:hypothetical protein